MSQETRIPIHHILEEMFGISQITSEEQLDEIVKELRKDPDKVIDFQKFVKGVKRNN